MFSSSKTQQLPREVAFYVKGYSGGHSVFDSSKSVAAPAELREALGTYRAPHIVFERFLEQLKGTTHQAMRTSLAHVSFDYLRRRVEIYNESHSPTLPSMDLPTKYRTCSVKESFKIELGCANSEQGKELMIFIGFYRTVMHGASAIATAKWYVFTTPDLEPSLNGRGHWSKVDADDPLRSQPLHVNGAGGEAKVADLDELRSLVTLQERTICYLTGELSDRKEEISQQSIQISELSKAFTDLSGLITRLLTSFQSRTATQTDSGN